MVKKKWLYRQREITDTHSEHMAKFPTTLILFEITSTTIDDANLEIQKSDRIVTLLNSNLSGKMQGKYVICWFMFGYVYYERLF